MKKSDIQLQQEITHAKKIVVIHGIYAHYKNPENQYLVIDIAHQEATNKPCVVYKKLYGKKLLFIRDLDNWLEPATSNGKKVERFTFLRHATVD